MGVRNIRTRLTAAARSPREAVIYLLVAVAPLAFLWSAFAEPGIPFGYEMFSNLVPAMHARADLAAGRLPLYAEWFGGRPQFANPLWYGLYPGAWLLFVPAIPLTLAAKVVVGAHIAAVPVIAYYYQREVLPMSLAAPAALLWVLPVAAQISTGHIEKIFAWPWVVLMAWQLTPSRLNSPETRPGLIAGVSLGMMALAGANYYFLYFGLFAAVVILAVQRDQFRGFVVGGLVGLPHVASIIPSLLHAGSRPPVGYSVGAVDIAISLLGLQVVPMIRPEHSIVGYVTVGGPAVLLGAIGAVHARHHRRWVGALGLGALLGVLLASAAPVLYQLPVINIFRAAGRASILVPVVVLLLVPFGLRAFREAEGGRSRVVTVALVGLLLASASLSGVVWMSSFSVAAEQPGGASDVANAVVANGCNSVWVEYDVAWKRGYVSGVRPAPMSYAVTAAGLEMQGGHYGSFGQDWRVWKDGEMTFDALVSPRRLPEAGPVPLSKPFNNDSMVATVPRSKFSLVERVQTESGPMFIYEVGDSC